MHYPHCAPRLAARRAGKSSAIHAADPRTALGDAALTEALHLVSRLAAALAPLESITAGPELEFAELATRHCEAVVRASDDGTGNAAAFASFGGEVLEAAFADITARLPAAGFSIAIDDYLELFRITVADRVVRRPGAPESRIRIYGRLEARLVGLDRVVIGGLVEGVWPPAQRCDPWLSRPMRQAWALNRRSGASVSPRTISRSFSDARKSSSRGRQRSRVHRRWRRASYSGSPP